jgi:hypothetical protein
VSRTAKGCLVLAAIVVMIASSIEVGARGRTPGGSVRSGGGVQRSADRAVSFRGQPRIAGDGYKESEVQCTASAGAAVDMRLDCDTDTPNNEPDVYVDPTDPRHMIASSNDYDQCCDAFYTTFDGGDTWQVGDMSAEGANRTGSDPVTVIDPVTGNAVHSSLNFRFTKDGQSTDGDVVVSVSKDGGLTWGKPIEVYDGEGADLDKVQIFNDKEWITVDADPSSPFYGRMYLTWSRFKARHGEYTESPIWESHSDDGGMTWSKAHEISGSGAFCTYQEAGPANQCDEDQGSVPAVAPDGTVYVAFVNEQDESTWERDQAFDDTYVVVRSTDGGETWSDPIPVVDLEDGAKDYPKNVDGRQTLSGYQVRVNAWGNIDVGPDGTLYLVFADNRNGTHDVANPVTNTDVFLMSSGDGGTTWSSPVQVDTSTSDQWFPWLDVNPVDGSLGILYHSRRTGDPDLYDTVLAQGHPGSFSYTVLNSEPSDPTNSLFFQANVEGCKKCATFHGDYNRVDYGSDGVANCVWTDMSVVLTEFDGDPLPKPRNAQFIFFRRV